MSSAVTVRVGLGNDNLIDGLVALDMPLSARRSRRALSLGMRQQDGYVTRPDGTDLGDTDTFFGMFKGVWTPSDRVRAHVHRRHDQFRRERQPAGIRDHQRGRHLPACCEPGRRVPGTHRRCGAAAGTAGPAAGADDQRSTLRQRFPGARVRTATTARCRCTARSTTWACRSTSRSTSPSRSRSSRSPRTASSDWTGARDADNTPLTILHTEYDVTGDQLSEELQFTLRDRSAGRRRGPVLLRADFR